MQRKSLITNSLYNISRTFITLFFPLIIFIYASRILGPDGIGKVEFSKNLTGYFVLLASLGINNYGTREGAKLRDNKLEFSKFVREILIINIFSSIFSLLLFFFFINNVDYLKSYKNILMIFSITIIMTPLGIEWFYGALEEYKYIAIRTLFFQILSLLILFLCVKTRNDIIWYTIVLIISSVGSNLANIIHSRKILFLYKGNKYNVCRHIKPILILFALAISNSLYSYIDITMIGFISNDREVGLYTSALKVNRIVTNVLGATGAVMMPRLSYLWNNGNIQEFKKIVKIVKECILLVSIPCFVGVIGLSKQIIFLVCGTEYFPAVSTMRILSIIIVFLTLSTFYNMHILVPVNEETKTLKSILFGLIVNIFLNVLYIPKYGRDGAAIGTVVGELVVLLIGRYYAHKIINVKNNWLNYVQYIIASIPILVICFIMSSINNILIQTIISMIISVILYLLILYLLKNEFILFLKDVFIQYIKRKKNENNSNYTS